MEVVRFEAAGLKCIEVGPGDGVRADLPLVVVLHGRGDWGESYVDIGSALGSEYRFVFPTAPLALPGALFEWFRFESANLGPAIAGARAQVTRLLDELTARYATPANRTVLGGFSQGGMMTLDVGLRYGQKLAGLLALSSALIANAPLDLSGQAGVEEYYGQDKEIAPVLASAAERGQGPVFVAHGAYDPVVPVAGGRGTRDLLQASGLEVEYYEFRGGHEITLDELNHIREFLKRVLK